jgi:F-box/leucine-rich repeat protein 14
MIQRLPLLTTLNLGCCSQLSDCAFNNVTALQQLKITDLSFCSISDKTMKLLGKSTSLQELDVSYCSAITNLGLMHIAAVTTLQQLRICGCRELKGDTVKPLTSLVNLKSLEVSYTKIPKQHLDELSQVLPRLSIFDWGENF